MPPVDPPTTITLRLKVPPGYLDTTNDEVPLGSVDTAATIGALREQIQRDVATHPAPAAQRLLYAGRALVDNAQTLADALNTRRDTSQTEYVVHLLVKDPAQNAPPTGSGPSHRRVLSTPTTQLHPPNTNTPPPAPHPAHAQQHNAAHQQEVHRQMQATQQMAMQAMAQAQRIMVPPIAGNLVQHTWGGGVPQPGMNMPGFGQAVAQGQQQRAAAGMHGMGGPTDGAGQQQQSDAAGIAPGQADAPQEAQPGQPTSDGNAQPQQAPQAPAVDANGQYITFPDGRRVQVSAGSGINIPALGINIPITNLIPQINQLLQQRAAAAAAAGGVPPQRPQSQPAQPAPQHATSASHQPPIHPQTAIATSALDRARDNMAEMRRMLDEMRNSSATTDEQRSCIENLQERTRSLNDYIDPMHLHGANRPPGDNGRRSAPPHMQAQPPQVVPPMPPQRMPLASPFGPGPGHMAFGAPPGLPPMPPFNNPVRTTYTHQMIHAMPVARPHPMPSPSDATCFLLSGPQGPQALLLSPQHGTYTTSLARSAPLAPTPTVPQQSGDRQAQDQPNPNPVANQVVHNAEPAQPPQQQQPLPAAVNPDNPMGALQPLFNHFWLLLRVLIFAYFFLGSNMGWKRPATLLLIGLGFWLVRAGLFGEGRIARRWWDGIMHPNGLPPRDGQQQPGAQDQPPHQPGQGGRQPMPTPEQVAQRLINERNQARDERLRRWRDLVRPVERVIALFVASLWPGVGEAAVRAREEEERRRAEEEIARRRAEEEERAKRDEASTKAAGEGKEGEGGEKAGGQGGEEAEVTKEVVASASGGSQA
ncbi:hypothetical protein Tdes44962_MAKER09971 [Teratosphaeria destructans]|uniref:Ubiquitin-like domain-containing protein n=1 Tax=Teratosphaeria destructans TaxID=418781 RepID=A0A9W7W1W4_9PEZI|nr:hypothetical protein Tdes44962_MAKER09971 [Teratosphaeria destructans]